MRLPNPRWDNLSNAYVVELSSYMIAKGAILVALGKMLVLHGDVSSARDTRYNTKPYEIWQTLQDKSGFQDGSTSNTIYRISATNDCNDK